MFPRKYERGQGLVEYALLLVLVVLVVIGLLVILGVGVVVRPDPHFLGILL
jgi:Flp pilus assembly pilin Flp